MQQSMVRVIREDFRPKDRHGKPNIPTLNDYVEVPRLSTYGTFRVLEMLSMEELAELFILQKRLSGLGSHDGRQAFKQMVRNNIPKGGQ